MTLSGQPTARLSDRDWRRVERALLQGAQAHGFDNDLWTLPRIAEVIWRLTGVSYHPGHVWWLLRRHRWSPQRPARRAANATSRRSPAGAPRSGPGSKGAAEQGAWLCFLDESGVSLTPPVRRTWAPVGHTPVLHHRMRGRRRLSMAAVCCYRPDASDARLAFRLREGAYDTDQLIGVVAALRKLQGGSWPVIVVWDNLPAHTSLAMRAWAADQHAWLIVEYLPA